MNLAGRACGVVPSQAVPTGAEKGAEGGGARPEVALSYVDGGAGAVRWSEMEAGVPDWRCGGRGKGFLGFGSIVLIHRLDL